MNAQKTHNQHKERAYSTNMRVPVFASVGLHLFVIILGTVSLPYVLREPDMTEMAIPIEMVDMADVAQTNNDAPPKEEKEPEKPPAKEQPPKPVYNHAAPDEVAPEPDLLTPKPPEVEEIPEPPKPEDVKKEKPKPQIVKPPKPRNKPKPPAPKKVEQKPKDEKKDEPAFPSLLNSVLQEDTSSSQTPETAEKNDSAQESQVAKVSPQMLSSMEASLNSGIRKCWNVNAGGKYAETLVVKLQVEVTRQRTVSSVRIIDQGRYGSDPAFQAAADAARRALLNPACWPLRLPEDKYDIWKSFTYTFDPSSML